MFHELITQATGLGTKDKQALVNSVADNEDIKELFRLMLCPGIVYNIKKVPDEKTNSGLSIEADWQLVISIQNTIDLDQRGKALKSRIACMYNDASKEHKAILSWVLDRKNPAKIGKSIVNTTWPGLIRTQEYMGAVSGTQEHLERLPWDTGVNVQTKVDGMSILVAYLEGTPVSIRTRAGNRIDQYIPIFFSRLPEFLNFTGIVHHELLVYDSEEAEYLDRATGNGLINHLVKSGKQNPGVDNCIQSVILDLYTDAPQKDRYFDLADFETEYSSKVYQIMFYSLETARVYTQELIKEGGEGTICKDPSKPFKNGKPWYCVKIKNEFEVELRVIGFKLHSKHSEKLGSLRCVSEDSLLVVNVGSGFSDMQRFVDPQVYIGEIITVRANEVINSKDDKEPSLYLPRYIEVRSDKTKADTYTIIKEQEQASKRGLND